MWAVLTLEETYTSAGSRMMDDFGTQYVVLKARGPVSVMSRAPLVNAAISVVLRALGSAVNFIRAGSHRNNWANYRMHGSGGCQRILKSTSTPAAP